MSDESAGPPEAPEAWKWVASLHHHFQANREYFMKPAVWAALLLSAGLGYVISGHEYGERLQTAKERGDFLNEQLSAYKDRLQGASPDQAAKQLTDLSTKVADLNKIISDITRVKTKSPLSQDQKSKLRTAINNHWKNGMAWQDVYTASNSDDTSSKFVNELIGIFSANHLNLVNQGYSFTGSDEKGVVIYLIDPKRPTAQAAAFMAILNDAGIPYMLGKPWVPRGAWAPMSQVGFQVFVGPDS
jgi:hypothetical protein